MNNSETNFNLDDINPVEMKMLSEQVDIILRALELYAYNLEYMLDGEKSSDDERQKKIAMLKYTYEQVLSDQAEQVNTKRNNTNNLTAYGQKMINDSNIINMIPKKQRYKSCIKNFKILVKKGSRESFLSAFYNLDISLLFII